MCGIPHFPTCKCLLSNARCRDTVCSVGIIPHSLPFTRSNTAIRHFRHAMSLDERRAMFKANYYHLWDDNDPKSMKLKEENDGPKTDVREVWFAGCHCGTCNHLKATLPDFISSRRRRWRVGQERYAKQSRKNSTSLDDSRVFPCQHRNSVLS